jgi:hypothetical protein
MEAKSLYLTNLCVSPERVHTSMTLPLENYDMSLLVGEKTIRKATRLFLLNNGSKLFHSSKNLADKISQ